jgi:hypothetical protein
MPVASEMLRTVSTAKTAVFMSIVSFVAICLHQPLWQDRLYGRRCAGEVSPCTSPAHFILARRRYHASLSRRELSGLSPNADLVSCGLIVPSGLEQARDPVWSDALAKRGTVHKYYNLLARTPFERCHEEFPAGCNGP